MLNLMVSTLALHVEVHVELTASFSPTMSIKRNSETTCHFTHAEHHPGVRNPLSIGFYEA
jgi:hypothetical protein